MFTWRTPNTLTEFQSTKRVNTTIVRKFYPKGIEIEMEAKGVVAKTIFSRRLAQKVVL